MPQGGAAPAQPCIWCSPWQRVRRPAAAKAAALFSTLIVNFCFESKRRSRPAAAGARRTWCSARRGGSRGSGRSRRCAQCCAAAGCCPGTGSPSPLPPTPGCRKPTTRSRCTRIFNVFAPMETTARCRCAVLCMLEGERAVFLSRQKIHRLLVHSSTSHLMQLRLCYARSWRSTCGGR